MVGLIVAQGGDLLPYADGFAAVGTDGLAGVTGAGAGGSQCALRLGVGMGAFFGLGFSELVEGKCTGIGCAIGNRGILIAAEFVTILGIRIAGQCNGIVTGTTEFKGSVGEGDFPLVCGSGLDAVSVAALGANIDAIGILQGHRGSLNSQRPDASLRIGDLVPCNSRLDRTDPSAVHHARGIASADDHHILAAGQLIQAGDLNIAFFGRGLCLPTIGADTAHIIVAGGRRLITDIAVAAKRTGIGGVAVLRTGRCGHNSAVAMLTGFLITTSGAKLVNGNVRLARAITGEYLGIIGVIKTEPVASIAALCLDCCHAAGSNFNFPGAIGIVGGLGAQVILGTGGGIQIPAIYAESISTIHRTCFQGDDLNGIAISNSIAFLGHLRRIAVIAILRGAQRLIVAEGHNNDLISLLERIDIGNHCGNICGGLNLATDRADAVLKAMSDHIRVLALVAVATGTGISGIALGGTGGGGHNRGISMGMSTGSIAAGGADQIGRDLRAKEQEGKLRIVNEHITGAGDGLNRVVTAHFPSINRVFLHPLQQNVQAFNHALAAPHGDSIAPANIDIEQNTGHITTQVIGIIRLAVGMIECTAFAISLVATGAIFSGRSGSQHHNVVFAVFGGVTLAVGPGVLPVPCSARIPGGANGLTGIEGRNGRGIATVLAVGVLEQIPRGIVRSLVSMVALHQALQRSIQGAAGRIGSAGAASLLGQGIIGCGSIERFRIGRQRGGCFATGAPVVDVFAGRVVDILKVGSIRHDLGRGQQADAQHQRQQQGQTTFDVYVHKCSLLICLMDFPFVQMHITSQYNYNIFTGGTQWYFPKKHPPTSGGCSISSQIPDDVGANAVHILHRLDGRNQVLVIGAVGHAP